jgi:hypothetical protein
MRGVAEKEVCSIIGALVRELVRIRPAKEASLAGRRSLMLLVLSDGDLSSCRDCCDEATSGSR